MADRFLITGLPRSRTSWLANLFTYGPCFCLHDGCQYGKAGVLDRMTQIECVRPALKHVGNADSGVALMFDPGEYPVDKVVVVWRATEDVCKSALKFFTEHPYPQQGKMTRRTVVDVLGRVERGIRSLVREMDESRVLMVRFEDLNRAGIVEDVWDFVCPEEPFDRERFALLDQIRVNPMSEKVRTLWE